MRNGRTFPMLPADGVTTVTYSRIPPSVEPTPRHDADDPWLEAVEVPLADQRHDGRNARRPADLRADQRVPTSGGAAGRRTLGAMRIIMLTAAVAIATGVMILATTYYSVVATPDSQNGGAVARAGPADAVTPANSVAALSDIPNERQVAEGSPGDGASMLVTPPTLTEAKAPLPRLRPALVAPPETEPSTVIASATEGASPQTIPPVSPVPADAGNLREAIQPSTAPVLRPLGGGALELTPPEITTAGTSLGVGDGSPVPPDAIPTPDASADPAKERLMAEIDEILASHPGAPQSHVPTQIILTRPPENALPPPIVIVPSVNQSTPIRTSSSPYANSSRPPVPPADIPNVGPLPPVAVPPVDGGYAVPSVACAENGWCWAIPVP